MAEVYVERSFSAAHDLPGYDGPCQNLHGHTFRCEIWLKGPINRTTGMVVDFKRIKEVIDVFDHAYLNDFLALPTAERLAEKLKDRLQSEFPDLKCTVRVWESEHAYAEV